MTDWRKVLIVGLAVGTAYAGFDVVVGHWIKKPYLGAAAKDFFRGAGIGGVVTAILT